MTALAVVGLAFGVASFVVMSQDIGSCPAQKTVGGSTFCDHAYYINGSYVWMQPLYTELGIVALAFLASAMILGASLRLGRRRA